MAENANVRYLEPGSRTKPQVVAVVLDDGTVRSLGPNRTEVPGGGEFGQGRISGGGWIVWFQRRSFGRT
jgi:hypothetical protein